MTWQTIVSWIVVFILGYQLGHLVQLYRMKMLVDADTQLKERLNSGAKIAQAISLLTKTSGIYVKLGTHLDKLSDETLNDKQFVVDWLMEYLAISYTLPSEELSRLMLGKELD